METNQMTSQSINTFVGDLVAMAQAQEQLPIITRERDEARQKADDLSYTVMQREESILSYKSTIETLNQRIRSLEVERDDAGFRALELEDKAHSVLASLGNILANVNDARVTLDPPKPEPVAEPIPYTPVVSEGDKDHPDQGSMYELARDEPPMGQSATDPTPSLEPGQNETVSTSLSTDPASGPDTSPRSLTEADLIPEPTNSFHRRYHGVKYWDIPQYVHKDVWLDNGGAEEDYRLSPTHPISV